MITLSAFVANPKSKRLESQTRLIQIQPTLIPLNCEQFWTPLLVLSGLGNSYSNSKCCITGAVHAHLQALLSSIDPDFGSRYARSAQLDWSFFQFTTAGGANRTQPVAVLKLCKNDPDDQSDAAVKFSKKVGNLILGNIFESNPAAHTAFDFCGFTIRVHRVDRSGTIQPLGDTLRRDLTLPSPSDDLFKIILQNLSPYPSLPLILQRLQETGIAGIENISYVQVESSRAPRPNRLDWQNQFQVALFLTSSGNAHALLHPHNQSHISQCLAPLLEDSSVPLILIPPVNLPLVSPSDPLPPLRFPQTGTSQQSLQGQYRKISLSSMQQLYIHPAPAVLADPASSTASSSSASPRAQSPKRARNPRSAESAAPKTLLLLEPTEDDSLRFNQIHEQLVYLFGRVPADTYSFISSALDHFRDELSQAGMIDEEGEKMSGQTQDIDHSSSSFHTDDHMGDESPTQTASQQF